MLKNSLQFGHSGTIFQGVLEKGRGGKAHRQELSLSPRRAGFLPGGAGFWETCNIHIGGGGALPGWGQISQGISKHGQGGRVSQGRAWEKRLSEGPGNPRRKRSGTAGLKQRGGASLRVAGSILAVE